MAATVQAALAVVKFYFLAAVLEVEAEMVLAAGRLLKSYLEVHFRIGDAKAVYSPGTPLSSFLSVAQKTVGRQVDITTTY